MTESEFEELGLKIKPSGYCLCIKPNCIYRGGDVSKCPIMKTKECKDFMKKYHGDKND